VKTRQPLSDRKRFMVLKRDGYACRICHKAGGELEVDHVLPVSRGGTDVMDNLQTLCKRCNRGKGGSLQ
jgi:5-methylcytosine-specific restriction endonuclease McrA